MWTSVKPVGTRPLEKEHPESLHIIWKLTLRLKGYKLVCILIEFCYRN